MHRNSLRWVSVFLVSVSLACTMVRQTPIPAAEVQQINFEVQTATPTVSFFTDAPTETPDPRITPTISVTATATLTTGLTLTATVEVTATAEPAVTTLASAPEPAPSATPVPAPTATPLEGGVWSFEDGFAEWANPYGDRCPGSGLAIGWNAFTTRDQFGSSCMNQTVWAGNVHSGQSAQEITFAYVGVQAGIFRSVPTVSNHRYRVEAMMKREFSPAKLEVSLGLDPAGGTDWQAETVQWFPWDEDLDDAWSKTEETITATGESMTIFIKGRHPYPEPGGTLRLDSVSVVDLGPE